MLNYVQATAATFSLPEDAIHFDVGADGRLYAVGVDAIWRESAPGSRNFLSVMAPAFGNPEFIRISPSGAKAAVGNYANSTIYVFNLGATATNAINATSYDAEWYNEQFLLVSNQGNDGPNPPSDVILVDTVGMAVRRVIANIPGYSGGVTVDLDGNLYTGIGLAVPVGPDTGLIKAFSFADWSDLLAGPAAALDFTTSGRPGANLLSAAFLTFDGDGNLFVGGGGGIGAGGAADMGYAAVVSRSAIDASLNDQPPVNTTSPPSDLQSLNPTPTIENEYWLLNVNPVRREAYLKLYDSPEILVYRPNLLQLHTTTEFQLGDNPGYYAGKRFVGMHLSMPVPLPQPAQFTGPLCVRLKTSYVESYGVSSHRVRLNGHEIGRIVGGQYHEVRETRDLTIERTLALSLIAAQNPGELVIDVDPAPGPGLADDFVLDAVEIVAVPT